MKSEISKAVHQLFSTNQHDAVVSHSTPNIQIVNYATGQVFNGQNEFRQFMSGFKNAFPDLVLKHNNIFENGNQVAIEIEGKGTHTGALETPAGAIPPTGKTVNFIVCEIHKYEGDKICSIHNYQDSGSLMRQLGVM